MAQRAADRIGQTIKVLVESDLGDGEYEGRGMHQAPDVDGSVTLLADGKLTVGDFVMARVTGSDGADLEACPV